MITGPLAGRCCPCIYMNMFDLRPSSRDSTGHENVVDLLSVLLVDVGVPLGRLDARDFVDIVEHAGEVVKHRARLHEFVHVATENDTGVPILCEDRAYEILFHVKSGMVRDPKIVNGGNAPTRLQLADYGGQHGRSPAAAHPRVQTKSHVSS